MKWIVDAQLPPALAGLLVDRNHEASHVAHVGLRDSSDSEIWDHALRENAIIITKDEDFQNRALVAESAPGILWLRIGNCSRRALLEWFEPLLDDIVERFENGETIIEIR